MIKGAETIAQFKILEWVQSNFKKDSITVEFTDTNRASIHDKKGATMKVMYVHDKGVVQE